MFQRFMNTIRRFMVGRYGTDHLNRFLFVVYLVVWLAERLFGGWILLGETLLPKEFIGCLLMLGASVIAQIPTGKRAIADKVSGPSL